MDCRLFDVCIITVYVVFLHACIHMWDLSLQSDLKDFSRVCTEFDSEEISGPAKPSM